MGLKRHAARNAARNAAKALAYQGVRGCRAAKYTASVSCRRENIRAYQAIFVMRCMAASHTDGTNVL